MTRPAIGPADGQVYADQAVTGSLVGAAGTLLFTRSAAQAAEAVLAASPKAARYGPAAFTAGLGTALARHGVLVRDPERLRQLERVDTLVIDPWALYGDRRTVLEVRPDPAARGKNVRLAKMTLNFGPITQAYTSRVIADPEALTIAAKAVDGPFAYLDSIWTFEPEGQGTRVRFEIDFKISNPFIAAVAEPAFAAKQDEIIRAFAEEADRRFGG